MNNKLPSKNLRLLRNLLGKKFVSIRRQLFKSDMDLDDFEQNADGPVGGWGLSLFINNFSLYALRIR